MMPQSAHLAAYPSANMLIISDRAANVSRIVRIVQRIDRTGDGDFEVIRLEHASASEIVRVINSLAAAQGAEFGFIKFGSRVDVLLPLGTTVTAKLGDVVQGSITPIARFER